MGVFNVINGNGALIPIGSFAVPTIKSGTFAPAATYTAGWCVAGLFSMALGAANAGLPFLAQLISVKIPGVQGGASLIAQLLEAAPTLTSAYNDGAPAILDPADELKLAYQHNVFGETAPVAGNQPCVFDYYPNRTVYADTAGTIRLALIANSALAITGTPTASWRVELRG